MFEKFVCVGAHPDDIELGMGGTLSKFRDKDIYIIVNYIPGDKETRILELFNSMEKFDIDKKNIFINDFYNLDERSQIKKIDEQLNLIKPNSIFTHFRHDNHQEHKNIFNIVNICCRRKKYNFFMWENNFIGGLTVENFSPNYFISLDKNNLDDKIESWLCHRSQNKKYNDLNDMIFKQAELWGFKVGCKYSEAFISSRIID